MRAFAKLIPFLTLIIGLLALYQFYGASMFAVSGQYGFAVFYAIFGFAGLVLAWALWSNRGKFSPPER